MTEIVKVAMLGILVAMVAIQFKSQKPEYALYIGLALAILIFSFVLGQVGTVLQKIDQIRGYLGKSQGYLGILFKVIGITYICEFSSQILKEAGYAAAAQQIEVLGKLSVMFAGLPILFAVIEQMQSFVK